MGNLGSQLVEGQNVVHNLCHIMGIVDTQANNDGKIVVKVCASILTLPRIGLGMGICIMGGRCNQPMGVGMGLVKHVFKGLPSTRLQALQRIVACYRCRELGWRSLSPLHKL
jgi:hypothetical protein